MALRLGSSTPSKLYLGSTEVTKAYFGAAEVYSSGPWTPAQLPGLALWLDADDSSTITLNGSNVNQWDDKSGNGRNASQATASLQPTYLATGFNGKPTLQTDGGDTLELGVTSLGRNVSGLTCALVGVHPAGQTFNQNANEIFINASSNFTTRFATSPNATGGATADRYAVAGRRLDTDNYASVSSTTDSLANRGNRWIRIAQRAYSDGVANHWTNGTQDMTNAVVTGQTAGNTSDADSLRAEIFGGVARLPNGSQLSEIVLTHSTMTTADRQKLEGYLAWKWGGATRPWTPADLDSSLALWLDADDASTITMNGSTVSQWKDKRVNGLNLSQATAANQPSYNTRTLNGKNVVEFSGNQMLWSTASVASGNPDVLMATVVLYDTSANADERVLQLSNGPGTSYAITGGSQGYSSRFNNGNEIYGLPSLATPLIQVGTRPSGGDYASSQMFINGTESARTSGSSDATVPNIGNGVSIGAGAISSDPLGTVGRAIDGYIAETVILSDVTLATRQKLEGYLAHKWGLQANLPASHPFKNAAPEVTL